MDQQVAVTSPDIDRTITYPVDPHGRWTRGRCRLRAWSAERVAVLTELDDNPSMSVTNACQYVVDEVRAVLADERQTFTLLEHYPSTGLLDDRFAVIHYERGSVATWSPMTPELQWLRTALAR